MATITEWEKMIQNNLNTIKEVRKANLVYREKIHQALSVLYSGQNFHITEAYRYKLESERENLDEILSVLDATEAEIHRIEDELYLAEPLKI